MLSKSLLSAIFAALAITPAACSPLVEAQNLTTLVPRASKSFAGSNNYYLHGLPVADQTAYVQTLASWGVKVVRLWVVGTSAGCTKGSTNVQYVPNLEAEGKIGTYDTTVLNALDKTLSILAAKGIKAIISPHDAGSVNGANGCDTYCKKYGNSDNFYGSNTAKADYDNRMRAIMNFKSPNFGGKRWADLSQAILAFDIQNEPMIGSVGKLQNNDPDDWICGRAGHMKETLGSSAVKVATGGIGGSQYCCDHEYNLLNKALYCDAIDIMSVHGYMGKAGDWAYFVTGDKSVLRQANGVGKHVMIEEWGVTSSSQDGFAAQVKVFNDAGLPWLYWQVVPGKDQTQSGAPSNCGYDGFEIGVASSKGNVGSAVGTANGKTAYQDWTGYV
ncbi:glycoside hydrolase family 5 protein [Aulographum hederae CBS 113979]|uniref:mannan endo-1,4-beta-mannosidase n=1 Tax=Aulographum hederae CBS 113979 TaxID=1176131 RepID=A0A6G1H1D8_9PEZI|nr:glycoside hydrolase family 5 protein [Aulographum hederae CBS 113979]